MMVDGGAELHSRRGRCKFSIANAYKENVLRIDFS